MVLRDNPPDFFLSAAGESRGDLARVRGCWKIARIKEKDGRDDYLLVKVEPVIIGQPYGLGSDDLSELLLSTRLNGHSLFPVKEWPCHVYITRLLDHRGLENQAFDSGQVEMIGWGTIFRDEEEARRNADRAC